MALAMFVDIDEIWRSLVQAEIPHAKVSKLMGFTMESDFDRQNVSKQRQNTPFFLRPFKAVLTGFSF